MIFTGRKLIYLHVQKTGGNSISKALMPFSDDQIYVRRHQDGVDRFSVTGAFTTRKHAKLADYHTTLDGSFDQYRVALPVRDPFERAVSLYFSPHKWMVQNDDGWEAKPSYWDFDRFAKMVPKMATLSRFLRIDGVVKRPDFMLRFNQIQRDFDDFCTTFDFPVRYGDLRVSNVTTATSSNRDKALGDERAKALAKERFKEDYRLLSEWGGL